MKVCYTWKRNQWIRGCPESTSLASLSFVGTPFPGFRGNFSDDRTMTGDAGVIGNRKCSRLNDRVIRPMLEMLETWWLLFSPILPSLRLTTLHPMNHQAIWNWKHQICHNLVRLNHRVIKAIAVPKKNSDYCFYWVNLRQIIRQECCFCKVNHHSDIGSLGQWWKHCDVSIRT